MGASCSVTSIDNAKSTAILKQQKSRGFRAQDLRAPIFPKSHAEKPDSKCNRKYCNEEIVKNWFVTVDTDQNGDISYEELRKSEFMSSMLEEEARKLFAVVDLDGNQVVDLQEFSIYHNLNTKIPHET